MDWLGGWLVGLMFGTEVLVLSCVVMEEDAGAVS